MEKKNHNVFESKKKKNGKQTNGTCVENNKTLVNRTVTHDEKKKKNKQKACNWQGHLT